MRGRCLSFRDRPGETPKNIKERLYHIYAINLSNSPTSVLITLPVNPHWFSEPKLKMHPPCPQTWKKCYPHTCTDTPLGPPRVAPKPTPGSPHNVLLLVDEHEVGNDPKQPVQRSGGTTLRRRYVWYHDSVNLATMNVPDIPIVINLDNQIGDPTKSNFRWEGFMFGESRGFVLCHSSPAMATTLR